MDDEGSARSDIHAQVLQNTLDEISSHREPGSAEASDLCCVICLEGVTEPCVAQPCAHRNFDFLCLISWLQESPKCPLCKANVKEVAYHPGDDPSEWKTFQTLVPESASQPSTVHQTATASVQRPWLPQGRRRRRERPPPPAVTADEAVLRRRGVYRDQLYSLHMGTNRYSRYKVLSPQLFETDADLVSRARNWIRRELQVFEFLSAPQDSDAAVARRRANNAEFLLEYIIAILKTVDTQGSQGQAEDMLQEFLGRENTRLFLHELRSYLRSPYTSLDAWDRNVQYDTSMGEPAGPSRRDEEPEVSRNSEHPQRLPRGGSHWRPNPGRYAPYHHHREGRSKDRWRDASHRYMDDGKAVV